MKIRRERRLFLVLFMASAAMMTAIDIYLGAKAEFFNAAELMRRTFLSSQTYSLFYGEAHFGAWALAAAWVFFIALNGAIAGLLFGPIKRILGP